MIFDKSIYFGYLNNKQIDLANKYLVDCVPDYLYKFYSLTDNSRLNQMKLDTLKNNESWCDIPENQNDPFDMKMAYLNENFAKEKGAYPESIEMARHLLNEFQNSFALCSFIDTDINNLPMWASYANNHKGYCVKYKVHSKEKIFRVFYETERIGVFSTLIQLYVAMKESSEQNKETKDLVFYRHCLFNILNCKHISWAYENEFRVIVPLEKHCGLNISNKAIGLKPLEIYLGINCSEENQEKISEIGREHLNCKVFKCKTSDTKFLEYEEIT